MEPSRHISKLSLALSNASGIIISVKGRVRTPSVSSAASSTVDKTCKHYEQVTDWRLHCVEDALRELNKSLQRLSTAEEHVKSLGKRVVELERENIYLKKHLSDLQAEKAT